MIVEEIVQKLQDQPIMYRIQVIEQLLQSVKEELAAETHSATKHAAPFRVQTFDLGCDPTVDRDEIYLHGHGRTHPAE